MRQVLRPYQTEALQALRAKLRSHRRLLLVSPTGSGKTTIAAEMIHGAMSRQRRVLFLAHRKELIDQCSTRLDQFSIPHGIIMAGHKQYNPTLPVQIASVQTLARRTKPPAQLIIVDEAHHARAGTYEKILQAYPGVPVVGLSATPWRTDGRGLGELFEDSVIGATIAQLTNEGHLVPATGFAYDSPELSQVHRRGGDYEAEGLELVMGGNAIAGNVVQSYLDHAHGKRAVLFATTVKHSRQMVERFLAAGVPAEHLDGETPKADREGILDRLRCGDTLLVSNVGVLTEGWDCLDSETEILTAQGWRGRGAVAEGDLVYSLNRDTERMELALVEEYGERTVRDGERMLTISSQHANIRTTEGHQFHIKYRDPARAGALSERFITRTGTELAKRRSAYALPLAAGMAEEIPGVPLTDDQLRLIAWFMTDGWFERGRTSLHIGQSKDYHHEIRALITRLGLDFTERERMPGRGFETRKVMYEFRIPKGTGRGAMARSGWASLAPYLDKDVSPLLHEMTKRQFEVFWAELLKGDGEHQGNKAGWLWCDRQSQADAYTWMATIRGLAASFSERITPNGHRMFRVSVRDAQWLTSDPADARAGRVQLESPDPGETVWCVRNRNSTLVTRRRGKIAIIGNCPSVEVCILARPTMSPGLYLQMVGRVLRPAPGKDKARIHDHAGCVLMHGRPDAERDYSLESDVRVTSKKKKDDLLPLRRCEECYAVYAATASQCPECSHVNKARRPPREVKATRQIPIEEIREVPLAVKRDVFARLRSTAAAKGYKPGWAAHRFKARFGHWPPRETA